tara:strand:+ start:302 stop:565 length:264 start_codon:yes stop_codon:yes gene_type:complete
LFLSNGEKVAPKATYDLDPGQTVTLRLPGGAGYGPANERDMAMVVEDVRQERVSIESAAVEYGVVIDPETLKLDEEATRKLRSGTGV